MPNVIFTINAFIICKRSSKKTLILMLVLRPHSIFKMAADAFSV